MNELTPDERTKIGEARKLFLEKRYAEARNMLEGINHPTAYEWQERLSKIVVKQSEPAKSWRRYSWMLVLLAILVAALLFMVQRINFVANTVYATAHVENELYRQQILATLNASP